MLHPDGPIIQELAGHGGNVQRQPNDAAGTAQFALEINDLGALVMVIRAQREIHS